MARAARKTGFELVWHIAGLTWAHPGAARLRGGATAAFGVALAWPSPPTIPPTPA